MVSEWKIRSGCAPPIPIVRTRLRGVSRFQQIRLLEIRKLNTRGYMCFSKDLSVLVVRGIRVASCIRLFRVTDCRDRNRALVVSYDSVA